MQKKKSLFILSSLAILCLVAGCNEKDSKSSSSSSSSSTTSGVVSSTTQVTPTVALTDEMFAALNQGYQAEVFTTTEYVESSISTRVLDLSVNEFNASIKVYSTTKEQPYERNSLSHDYHYQIDPEQLGEKMLYDAGLSIGNDVIYSPVLGKDPFSYEEYELTWEEGCYSNAFKEIRASHFTRVDNTNNWRLDLNNATLYAANTYDKLMWQLFNEDAGSDIQSFILKTDGDEIVGFELSFYQTSSGDGYVVRSSYGNFIDFGSDVVDYIKPLEGTEDTSFKAAIDKLKALNFEAEQTQQNYNFDQEKFLVSGIYKYQVEDGIKINYDVYTNATTKFANGGYYKLIDEEDQEEAKQGVVKIGDDFYKDYIYAGTMEEFLPDFNISSLCFVKDSSSTETKQVWKLNNDIRFSLDNYITEFTPFDSDGYADRIIYLTITIEANKINIHNETAKPDTDRGGLIFDANYTKFGEIVDLMPAANIHDDCDDLTWTQLISNNEQGCKNLISSFSKDVIDALPTIGEGHSDVYVDGKILFIYIYDLADALTLEETYKQKLIDAGYEVVEENAEEMEITLKSTEKVSIGTRQYYMNISLSIWWNKIQEFGQFQIALSLTSR